MQLFEAELEDYHRLLLSETGALVMKTPPPLRIVGRRGKAGVLAQFVRKQGVDYHGVLPGGRAVFFEAKEASRPRFYTEAVKPHQIGLLETAADAGALTIVLVRCSHYGTALEGEWFWLSPDECHVTSWAWTELAQMERQCTRGWLNALTP